ncbi:hypothetical protein K461DRAFT_75192 [Myriangium duriaei CBS 260.36]|uniref:MutL C-terminal dimerisation domain-containing protein n=1 Tax=Myriangium duriaei CBS 260.36 TaxID=1168546 RepID=A0A9P4J6E9_9PEZI|nr:hypothetical protein K461DRAFT_75192 [Myriangium duriaei CBS 260.36]
MSHSSVPHTSLEPSSPAPLSHTICALPPTVAARIGSTIAITNVADVVFGLVENSLDARATNISISVDLLRRACVVEDDGLGIHPDSFREEGGLCKIYHSSKLAPSSDMHGGQGVFLASLSTLSLLSISSRHIAHHSVNSLLMHRGQVLSRQRPSRTTVSPAFPDHHGTVINVRDLFGNVPVRVKQHAQIMENRAQIDKEWTDLLTQVAGLIMAWPFGVSVTLQIPQDATKRVHFRNPKRTESWDSSKVSNDSSPKISSRAKTKRAASIFSSFRFLPGILASALVPASAATTSLSVKGVISTSPHPTTRFQFISVGIKPVPRSSEGKMYYDAVNEAFSKSSFGTEVAVPDDKALDRWKSSRVQDLRVARKGLDRWPIYYLNLEPNPGSKVTDLSAPVTSESICKLLTALADGWLKANGFRPARSAKTPQTPSGLISECSSNPEGHSSASASEPPTEMCLHVRPGSTATLSLADTTPGARTSKRKSSRQLTPADTSRSFSNWSRIKGGTSRLKDDLWRPSTSSRPLIQANLISAGVNPSPHAYPKFSTAEDDEDGDCQSDYFMWEDTDTETQAQVSLRTGMLKNCCKSGTATKRPQASTATPTVRAIGSQKFSILGQPSSTSGNWLSNALRSWKNPIFLLPQSGDSSCFFDSSLSHDPMRMSTTTSRTQWSTSEWSRSSNQAQVQLTKQGLANVEVISQVDRKYVLIRLPTMPGSSHASSSSSILVLVDQHAASERCILESLSASLVSDCADPVPISSVDASPAGVDTSILSKPLRFQITAVEAHLLKTRASHFAAWGILYDLKTVASTDEASVSNEGDHTVVITHLPPTFSERCTQEPRLLVELIRKDLYAGIRRSGGTNGASKQSANEGSTPAWLTRMGSCPKGIIDLLNSRACRSAIMFNDELSLDECQRLILELSRCVFPFMCAHGRVSMVPLLSLGGNESSWGSDTIDKTGSACFAHAFEQWQDLK